MRDVGEKMLFVFEDFVSCDFWLPFRSVSEDGRSVMLFVSCCLLCDNSLLFFFCQFSDIKVNFSLNSTDFLSTVNG